MQTRVEVSSMTDAQLSSFRQAISASKGINDNRGYAYWAGLHGLPGQFCQHGTTLFLPWHRAYLYLFEKSLQDQVPGVTLPWWDWTSTDSHAQGVPASYTDTSADNPLQNAPVSISSDLIDQVREQLPGAISDGADPTTVRHSRSADQLPEATTIDSILTDYPQFDDFSTQLENVHNWLHVWVGGSMSVIPIAAYDPVFWAHHAMIDRLWYLWQMKHPSGTPSPDILNTALAPFPLTVGQVLDMGRLGYDYAVTATD